MARRTATAARENPEGPTLGEQAQQGLQALQAQQEQQHGELGVRLAPEPPAVPLPLAGDTVLLRCGAIERPAIVTQVHAQDEALDLVVFHEPSAYVGTVQSAGKASSFRGRVPRSRDGADGWTPRPQR